MKVGKAIYNILSQSSDVQSNFPFNTTDYSPTGTELVTNGDFSATGTEEVTYPNFTNSDISQWKIAESTGTDRATPSWNASEFMRLTYDLAQGSALYATFGHTLNASYKVTMRVRGTKADGVTAQGSAFSSIGNNGELGTVVANNALTADWQDYEFYIVSTSSTFRFYLASAAVGDLVDFDSISVLPLGEGWTLSAVGGITFNASGLSLDSSEIDTSGGGTVYSSCIQDGTIFEIGKSYKLEIESLDITSGSVELKFGRTWNSSPERPTLTAADNGTYTEYFTAVTDNDRFTINSDGGTVATIGSISIEEMVLNKIFPELAPPDIDAPYVVYSVVSNSPSETKNTNGDIDTANIEVYGFQDTYNKAVNLGVSVRAALDRKTGTYNTIEIQSTNYVNEQMDVNEARKLWAAIQDYTIRIKNI